MKKTLLIAAVVASQCAFAQMSPSQVSTPADIMLLQNDIPGIRNGFTELKVRTPVDANTFATWYNFTVGVTNGTITSTNYLNIDPAKPLDYQTRSTGSKTGNVYTAIVEYLDNDWTLDEKQTIYFDASGKDSLVVGESYDVDNSVYVMDTRAVKKYNGSGQFTGYMLEQYDGSDWSIVATRSIAYSGSQRTTDTVYAFTGGMPVAAIITNYFYSGAALDSIARKMADGPTTFAFSEAFKITRGADGGVDQVKTYNYDQGKDSLFVESRADFTGGTPVTGVKEISASEFGVYPVPATTTLNIDVKDGGVYRAELLDLQGRSLLSQTVSAQSSVDVSALSNGIYLLTLENKEGGRMQKRIVIGK